MVVEVLAQLVEVVAAIQDLELVEAGAGGGGGDHAVGGGGYSGGGSEEWDINGSQNGQQAAIAGSYYIGSVRAESDLNSDGVKDAYCRYGRWSRRSLWWL